MKRVRRRATSRQRVLIGAPDPALTGTSGVAAVAELVDALGVVDRLDRGIWPAKQRERGATAREVLGALAQSQLLDAGALVGLDRQRADVAAAVLSAVPGLASTTAAGLARRFGPEHFAGIESALAGLTGAGLRSAARRTEGGVEWAGDGGSGLH